MSLIAASAGTYDLALVLGRDLCLGPEDHLV